MERPGERIRLKDRIVDNISKSIKSIQELVYYQYKDSPLAAHDDGVVLFNNNHLCHKLCENLDHTLLHGLKHVIRGYWRVVKQLSPHAMVKEIDMLVNVTTELGKGRAWLYASLNEGLLESYIRLLCDNDKLLKKYYAKEALLLDKDRMSVLLTLASGLDYVTFRLDYDVPYLDLNAFPPRSRKSCDHESHTSSDFFDLYQSHPTRYRSRSEVLANMSVSTFGFSSDSDTQSLASSDSHPDYMKVSIMSADSGFPAESNFTNPTRKHSQSSSETLPSHSSASSLTSLADHDRHQRVESIVSFEGDNINSVNGSLEVMRVKSKKGNASNGKKKTQDKVCSEKKSKKSNTTIMPASSDSNKNYNSTGTDSELVSSIIINNETECASESTCLISCAGSDHQQTEGEVNTGKDTTEHSLQFNDSDIHVCCKTYQFGKSEVAIRHNSPIASKYVNFNNSSRLSNPISSCSEPKISSTVSQQAEKTSSCFGLHIDNSSFEDQARPGQERSAITSNSELRGKSPIIGSTELTTSENIRTLAESVSVLNKTNSENLNTDSTKPHHSKTACTTISVNPIIGSEVNECSQFDLQECDSSRACNSSQECNFNQDCNSSHDCAFIHCNLIPSQAEVVTDSFIVSQSDSENCPNQAHSVSAVTQNHHSGDDTITSCHNALPHNHTSHNTSVPCKGQPTLKQIKTGCKMERNPMFNESQKQNGFALPLPHDDDNVDVYASNNRSKYENMSKDSGEKSQNRVSISQGKSLSEANKEKIPGKPDDDNDLLETSTRDMSFRVDNNTILEIMLTVFAREDEKFVKMFVTRTGHTEGNPVVTHIVVSDQCLYILNYQQATNKFVRHSCIQLTDIIFISSGLNGQTLNIESRAKSKEKQRLWLSPGHHELSQAIVACLASAVKTANEHISGKSRFSVGTEVPLQKIALRKYISGELGCKTQDISLWDYSLVFWEDLSATNSTSLHKEGPLYLSSDDNIRAHIWKSVYVILKNCMLYVKTSKHEMRSLSYLSLAGDQCVGCRLISHMGRDNCVELIMSSGESWILSAASKTDISDWSYYLCLAVSQGTMDDILPFCVPCCAVLSCHNLFLCHENLSTKFYRSLGRCQLKDVISLLVDERDSSYCVINMSSTSTAKGACCQWVLYFNSSVDLERYKTSISSAWKDLYKADLATLPVDDPALQFYCQTNMTQIQQQLTLS